MFYQKTIQHYFLILSVILITIGNGLKATAAEANVFSPYLEQISQNLPPDLIMRLPKELWREGTPPDSSQYSVRVSPLDEGAIVTLLNCEGNSPSCFVGSFSSQSRTPTAVQALNQHRNAGHPITLSKDVTGYLLTRFSTDPSNSFSSVMWEQDNLIHTVTLPGSDRQKILWMAHSMANGEPVVPVREIARTEPTPTTEAPRELNTRGNNNPPTAQLPSELPEPVTPPPIPPPPPEPLPPAEELLDIPTLTPPPSTAPEFPRTISVQQFNVTGNTILGAEIDEVLQNFLNRPLTFAELLEVESAITQLYVENGYVNSGAVIPAGQTLEDGTVRIQVVEGSIEEIVIGDTGRLDPGYIRSRLRIASQTPLNANRIQEALQLLRQDPLIENIQAELSAGTRRDQSVLTVDVRRADPFRVQVQADNSRAPSVGTFQRGVQLSHGNVLGRGDALSIGYRNTDGSNRYEAGYTFPINPRNGTVSFSFSQSDNDIIEAPFDELDIESTTRSYELTFRQPIVRRATPNFLQEIALGLTGSHQQSETTLEGEPFPISLGADAGGNTRITALRFFQDWTRRDRRQVFAARSQFSLGIDAFDATINDDDPDSRFFSWRGQFQYLRQLGSPDTTLLFRTDIQFADSSLLPLEQFGSGGIYSVRGYRQDALLTDNGIFASAEVRLPLLRWNSVEGLLSVIPFIDFALGWNGGDRETPDPNSLVSVGLGVQWQMSDKFRLRFDYGIPLVDIDSRDRTWQENGLYFFVEYNGF